MYYLMQEVIDMQPLTFGERLALIRKRRKMTQRQLAEHIGCQQSDIHRLESGLVRDPHMSRLVALARVLGVSLDDLVGWQEDTQDVPRDAKAHEDVHNTGPTAKRQQTRKATPQHKKGASL
jgi:transcriptional regulator with XRE-family HTH domain